MVDLAQAQTVITVLMLSLLWALEGWLPFMPDRQHRLRHAARNLTLGLLNVIVLALLVAPLIVRATAWAESNHIGLLRLISLPPLVHTILALLLLDAWMYLWHRANHRVPLLWRFHKVHHSDNEMDATSATRFHTGEIAISIALRLIVIPTLGAALWHVLLYDLLLMPVILFHHSNVHFPESIDRWLRLLIVTPAIHRVHHSRERAETDSNYSSIFSFWDRLGRSFRMRACIESVQYGLDGYDTEEWQGISGLIVTPFTGPVESQAKDRLDLSIGNSYRNLDQRKNRVADKALSVYKK